MSSLHSLSITVLSTVLLAACATEIRPRAEPAGTETSAKLKTLETGAAVLQSNAPAEKLDVYIVAFYPLASDPSKQMEVYHYCHQLNQDVMQCALFDGNAGDAVLNGIEYIVSEQAFNTLPASEKRYWHPHNHAILSGGVMGPGLPNVPKRHFLKKSSTATARPGTPGRRAGPASSPTRCRWARHSLAGPRPTSTRRTLRWCASVTPSSA